MRTLWCSFVISFIYFCFQCTSAMKPSMKTCLVPYEILMKNNLVKEIKKFKKMVKNIISSNNACRELRKYRTM